MNIVRVFLPCGREYERVSPQAGVVLHKHYRFQYPKLQSKDDEAEWRETPTSRAEAVFTIT